MSKICTYASLEYCKGGLQLYCVCNKKYNKKVKVQGDSSLLEGTLLLCDDDCKDFAETH